MIVLINKYQLYNNNSNNNNKDKEITNGTSLGQKKSSLLSYALFISPASSFHLLAFNSADPAPMVRGTVKMQNDGFLHVKYA